ncbi:MAG: SH3 domain-containing protein [Lachnospiraceae bacterium]|nr:SH3 domain-containing protein [Lachnospiraceae bacterium]
MKQKSILKLLLASTLVLTMSGCSSLESEMTQAINNNQEIKLSVQGTVEDNNIDNFEWTELDQLDTFKDIRKTWDDKFQIVIFDMGSKNGPLYVDLNGNWAGNNVLYNTFQNKVFVKEYWSDGNVKSELAQAAITQFSDITNESTGIIASINAYFNLLPTNSDGTSGLFDILSRAQVMSAIYRGDTPVIYTEINPDFENAVSKNDYNLLAYGVTQDSYLKYENKGLNYDTYNSPMTRAEAIYMLMHRYFPEELANMNGKGNLSDCKNAGNVAKELGFEGKHAWESYELEYCLQNSEDGAPETLYNALALANNLGILSSETRWNQAISGGELITLMVETYEAVQNRDDYVVNAKTGANAGESLYIIEEVEVVKNEQSIGGVVVEEVVDVTNLDDLFDEFGYELDMTDEEIAEAYAIAEQFTFEPCDKWMQVDHCYFLNVRTGPSTDFRILRSVPAGTKAHIVARCVENGWYRVLTEGKLVYQCGVYFSDFEGSDTYVHEGAPDEVKQQKLRDIVTTTENKSTLESPEVMEVTEVEAEKSEDTTEKVNNYK